MLDDFERGDVVCVECGHVVQSPLLSWNSGPPRLRHVESGGRTVWGLQSSSVEEIYSTPYDDVEREKDERRRSKIRDVLSIFHLDNENTVEKVLNNYKTLYCDRQPRRGFKKTETKDRLALAVSICRQITMNGSARMPSEIADVCGVERASDLLNADKILNLNREEMRKGAHRFIDAKPEDYARLITANLELPRRLGRVAERFIKAVKMKRHLCGKKPQFIAGGVIHSLLVRVGWHTDLACKMLIRYIDCSKNSILNISHKLPEYDLEICGSSDNCNDMDCESNLSWDGKSPINLTFRSMDNQNAYQRC